MRPLTHLFALFILVMAVAAVCAARWRTLPTDDRIVGEPHYRIDINTADAATLSLLPGVGPTLAERIVAHRASHGRFTTPAALADVPGIGRSVVERVTPFVVCGESPGAGSTGATAEPPATPGAEGRARLYRGPTPSPLRGEGRGEG